MTQPTKCLIIAEAGVNHNGSLERALQMVDRAAEAGVDVVKFQTFKAESIASRFARKAEYQAKNTHSDGSQLEMIRALELSHEDHFQVAERCRKLGVEFLSTGFDFESLSFLTERMDIQRIKIPSGEITNLPLILQAARTGKPIIVSTGMSTLGEIEQALQVIAFGYSGSEAAPTLDAFRGAFGDPALQALLRQKVTLLHCVSEYPAPFDSVNLAAMDTMGRGFGLAVGYSDHTMGISIPLAAVARGATVIEKHFTLDRGLPGPDHKASLEPSELKSMVSGIREIEAALSGHGMKVPHPSEIKNLDIARKSLVARTTVAKGERFTPDNLTLKRPGNGVPPARYWDYLQKRADRDYGEDELIAPDSGQG